MNYDFYNLDVCFHLNLSDIVIRRCFADHFLWLQSSHELECSIMCLDNLGLLCHTHVGLEVGVPSSWSSCVASLISPQYSGLSVFTSVKLDFCISTSASHFFCGPDRLPYNISSHSFIQWIFIEHLTLMLCQILCQTLWEYRGEYRCGLCIYGSHSEAPQKKKRKEN